MCEVFIGVPHTFLQRARCGSVATPSDLAWEWIKYGWATDLTVVYLDPHF